MANGKPNPIPARPDPRVARPAAHTAPLGPPVLKRQLNLFLALLIIIIIGLGLGASTLIQERVAAMSGNLTTVRDQYSNCTDVLDTCQGRLSEKETKLNTTITDIQLYDALYQEKTDTLSARETELASTKDTLAGTQRQLAQTQTELKTVKSQLTVTQNEVANLNSQVVALAKQVADLKDQVNLWKDKYNDCRDECQ